MAQGDIRWLSPEGFPVVLHGSSVIVRAHQRPTDLSDASNDDTRYRTWRARGLQSMGAREREAGKPSFISLLVFAETRDAFHLCMPNSSITSNELRVFKWILVEHEGKGCMIR